MLSVQHGAQALAMPFADPLSIKWVGFLSGESPKMFFAWVCWLVLDGRHANVWTLAVWDDAGLILLPNPTASRVEDIVLSLNVHPIMESPRQLWSKGWHYGDISKVELLKILSLWYCMKSSLEFTFLQRWKWLREWCRFCESPCAALCRHQTILLQVVPFSTWQSLLLAILLVAFALPPLSMTLSMLLQIFSMPFAQTWMANDQWSKVTVHVQNSIAKGQGKNRRTADLLFDLVVPGFTFWWRWCMIIDLSRNHKIQKRYSLFFMFP